MITSRQIREARHLLGWAQWRLARQAGVALNTLARIENEESSLPISPYYLAKIEATLRGAGMEFIAESGGVRRREKESPPI